MNYKIIIYKRSCWEWFLNLWEPKEKCHIKMNLHMSAEWPCQVITSMYLCGDLNILQSWDPRVHLIIHRHRYPPISSTANLPLDINIGFNSNQVLVARSNHSTDFKHSLLSYPPTQANKTTVNTIFTIASSCYQSIQSTHTHIQRVSEKNCAFLFC